MKMSTSLSNLQSLSLPQLSSLYHKYFTQIASEVSPSQKFSDLLFKINVVVSSLIKSFTLIAQNTYEPLLQKNENRIRFLTRTHHQFLLQKEAFEQKILYLLRKEKDYEKLKEMTGAIIENGEFICPNRKENEILILRAENSNLKRQISKIEEIIKEKEKKEIEFLNEKKKLTKEINFLNQQLNLSQRSIHSHSNINININDMSHSNLVISNSKPKRNFPSSENEINTTECYSLRCYCSAKKQSQTKNKFISPYKTITSPMKDKSCLSSPSKSKKKNYICKKKKKLIVNTQSSVNNFLIYRSNNMKNTMTANLDKCALRAAFASGRIKIFPNNNNNNNNSITCNNNK